MDLALIAPTSGLDLIKFNNYQMALAHVVLEDQEYCDQYSKFSHEGHKIILDNSLWELKEALHITQLLEACRRLDNNVWELVLPDCFKSSEETISETENFLDSVNEIFPTNKPWHRNFVVPHGKNSEDWLECYDYFLAQPYAHTIGLPKVLDDIWTPGGRVGCCMFLEATGRIDLSKQYHCLGVGGDPIEVLMLSKFGWIRSLDTALPIHAGISNVVFNGRLGLIGAKRPKRQKDYFNTSAKDIKDFESVIRYNITLLDRWAHGIYTGGK